MAVAYALVAEWLANVPANDLTDLMIAERALYWGMTVPALTAMITASGIYTTVAAVPAAPGSPTAVPGPGAAKITVGWAVVAGARSYNVKRATVTNTEVTLVLGAGVSGVSFVDITAVTGTLYFYKVSALNVLGESATSTEVSATAT